MNSIYPLIKPFADAWEYYLSDPYMKDLEQFLGGGLGHDWNSKAARAEKHKYFEPYHRLSKRFNEDPEVMDVVEDNLARLTVLYGVDRHLTLRQAYGALKTRFIFGDNNTASFQRQLHNGAITGYFRGGLINLLQFVGATVHPLFYSRGTNYTTHYLYSSIFEVLLYPLDTIKTLLQADLHRNYKNTFDCISKVYENGGIVNFYKGLLFKLIFNGALIYNLRSVYENSDQQYLSFPLLALSYGFLTLKTRFQLCDTPLSFQEYDKTRKTVSSIFLQRGVYGLYRGLTPFLFLNTFFHYNLYALYSKEAQERSLDEIQKHALKQLVSPRLEQIWT